jgi:hypothetical protein
MYQKKVKATYNLERMEYICCSSNSDNFHTNLMTYKLQDTNDIMN